MITTRKKGFRKKLYNFIIKESDATSLGTGEVTLSLAIELLTLIESHYEALDLVRRGKEL